MAVVVEFLEIHRLILRQSSAKSKIPDLQLSLPGQKFYTLEGDLYGILTITKIYEDMLFIPGLDAV